LWDLDDGTGADDTDTETFADSELEAFSIAQVDVVGEGNVAFWAEERDAYVADWSGQCAGDGLENWADDLLEAVHGCGVDNSSCL